MSTMMGKWRMQRTSRVNIIICLLKHVSAAPLSVLSACGILRSTAQSVALYFVHGCSVSLPGNPEGESQGPTNHLLLSLGVALLHSLCHASPGSPRLDFDPLFNCLETHCHPHQVIHSLWCTLVADHIDNNLMQNVAGWQKSVFQIFEFLSLDSKFLSSFTVSAFTVNLTFLQLGYNHFMRCNTKADFSLHAAVF